MRTFRPAFVAAAVCCATLLVPGCNDSNGVTSPGGPMATAADVSGTWTGDFQSDSPAPCSTSAASASFSQQGTHVTGSFKALGCGIDGTFHGSVDGQNLTGSVAMNGCTGGGASGTMTDAGLRITVGDFTKPLVTGDKVIYPGGTVTFRR